MKFYTFLFSLSLMLGNCVVNAQSTTSVDAGDFSIVEIMPHYPACPEIEDYGERKKCAEKAMLEFIYSNVKYPQEAMNQGLEGMVVVSFIVEKNGKTSNPKILRSVGGGCDEEVLRIVNLFPAWIPGKQRGKNVKVQFNLPVRFKLQEEEKLEYTVIDTLNNETLKNLMPSYNSIQSLFCADYSGEFVEAKILNEIADEPMPEDNPCGFFFTMNDLKITYEINGKITEFTSEKGVLTKEIRDVFRNAKPGTAINLNFTLKRDDIVSEESRVILVR